MITKSYIKIKNDKKTKKSENFKTRFLFRVVYCSTLKKNIAYFHEIKYICSKLTFLHFYTKNKVYSEFRGEFHF